ncbi:hypothetical protein L1987_10013 [Smallanthus sonchifolius]|uniref:Uncharacterized protein n=1 Tax=Smallanthus sonchifolius TaxID=185202 RepID=A0ACB9JR95_9ASTR|nr:hypothetical protein L1987_10013 [Smallanthus sonchifolius]
MKAFRQVHNHYQVPNPLRVKKFTGAVHIDAMSNHSISSEWCIRAFPKLIKLSHLLKGLDLINGRLVNVENKCVVDDEFLTLSMRAFKSTGTAFVMQNAQTCVNKPVYKQPFDVNSLKKICDILSVSAQQRKLVRLAICPQVTQHQIWTGALMEILNQLEIEMRVKDYGCITKGSNMGRQIVVNCLRFLDDVMSYDPDSASWMRLTPKKDADSPPSAKWADLLEMFNDLINCLKNDHEFLFYVIKLEIMKEGLLQIKDVLVDKNIGYKEALHQQSLVQKKLTKSLGHSSRCLFTLLLYYLYGSIQDIDLDICCWLSEDVAGNKFYLCVGKIMTSDDNKMLMHVVKQLDRALGVVKFVHEMAEMKEILEIQGHLWCIGSKSRSLAYRGHNFFIHGISLE